MLQDSVPILMSRPGGQMFLLPGIFYCSASISDNPSFLLNYTDFPGTSAKISAAIPCKRVIIYYFHHADFLTEFFFSETYLSYLLVESLQTQGSGSS